jgi:hypothetical protein
MTTETQRRSQIIRQIKRIPLEKLNELEEYLSKIEKENSRKIEIMSYAGSWKGINDDCFNELTTNLINNRQRNRRRIDG